MSSTPSLAIHGGAGVFPREVFTPKMEASYLSALEFCLDKGWRVLDRGGSALDAVDAAARALEDKPHFNAGHGSVLNEDGRIECDAAIMAGDGRAGAVAGVSTIRNPVALARLLLDDERVVFLTGAGAARYAKRHKVKIVPEEYFVTSQRIRELEEAKQANLIALDQAKFGTIGAVARDRNGQLAAATSTGGLTNKLVSRIGDGPIIGAGTYAKNETCAVSCTGVGEVFIREVVGHEVSSRVRFGGQSLHRAVSEVVHDVLAPLGGIGGVIAVGPNGAPVLDFNSPSMYRGWRSGEGKPHVAIFSKRPGRLKDHQLTVSKRHRSHQ